jgi:hypothetical protein
VIFSLDKADECQWRYYLIVGEFSVTGLNGNFLLIASANVRMALRFISGNGNYPDVRSMVSCYSIES